VRPGLWSLLLAGVCVALLAGASIAATPAQVAAGTTFTLIASPKCETGETAVGQACFKDVQGTKLKVTSASTSGSAEYSTDPAEGGAQWKNHFTWKVPQTITAGTKLAGGIQLGIAVSDVQPPQPLQQGIKGFAPGFAEQVIAQYPTSAAVSKPFDYTLFASATAAFTITIEMQSSTVTYHYAPKATTPKCTRARLASAGTSAPDGLEASGKVTFHLSAHGVPAHGESPTLLSSSTAGQGSFSICGDPDKGWVKGTGAKGTIGHVDHHAHLGQTVTDRLTLTVIGARVRVYSESVGHISGDLFVKVTASNDRQCKVGSLGEIVIVQAVASTNGDSVVDMKLCRKDHDHTFGNGEDGRHGDMSVAVRFLLPK
jgi:hypothetical protein